MLAACRAAAQVDCVIVAPETAGRGAARLPRSRGALVRLNLVVGRDCKELMLDEWGLRVELTFRGRRHACAIPWEAVVGGLLAPPARPRPRFGVIQGGEADEPGAHRPARGQGPGAAPRGAAAPRAGLRPGPMPRRRWPGGRCAPCITENGGAPARDPAVPVSAEGIEPSTYGLRVHCSAS